MFGEPLYRTREEKSANLLYFLIKDHPFTDGNKRIGSLLFLPCLRQEGLRHDLNPQALTALTLLIAEKHTRQQGPDDPPDRQSAGGAVGVSAASEAQ